MAGTGQLDGWTWVTNPRNGGSTYDPERFGYPWRVVFHEIQGEDRVDGIAVHKYPPHLWYDPKDRARHQTVPLHRGAFALEQPGAAPHYTNRARAIQIELAGFTEETPVEPDEWLTRIAEDVLVPVVEWVRSQGGDVDLDDVPDPGPMSMSATATAPQRMTWDRWARFGGVCSHRHVPGNSHWDTGGLRLDVIAARAKQILAGFGPAVVEDDELNDADRAFITDQINAAIHAVVGAADGATNAAVQHPGFETVRTQMTNQTMWMDQWFRLFDVRLAAFANQLTKAVSAAAGERVAAIVEAEMRKAAASDD